MTWSRTQFEITNSDGKNETVSGWTSPAGLGVHVEVENIDNKGRHRWHVTHLRSGIFFLRLNASNEQATELAELLVNQANWSEHGTLYDLSKADPEWVARLVGVKHTLGGDWMEFPEPEMNDPHNVVMMPHRRSSNPAGRTR